MAEIELPIRPVETLPPGTCYTTEQARLVAFAAAMRAVLAGQSFFSQGPDIPDPEFNNYLWYRTTDGLWYFYSGGWLSPVPPSYNTHELRMWDGSLGDLATYDGGDTDAPSDRSGPMWEVAAVLEGRVPVGVGTLQPSGTAVAVTGTGGADEHTLTDDEVPPTAINPLDSNNEPITDKRMQKSGDTFGFSAFNGDFSGEDAGGRMTDILLEVAGGGQPHPNMPPYYGVYFIRWTGRLYRKVT